MRLFVTFCWLYLGQSLGPAFPETSKRATPLVLPFPILLETAGAWPDSQYLAGPAVFLVPGPRNVRPLVLFENLANLIMLRLNQGHIKEATNFKARMKILERVREESCAAVCPHQKSVVGKKRIIAYANRR